MALPSTASDLLTFALGATASIGASAILAWRIERVGSRLAISEALLGMVAALAADSPEITSSVSALSSGQHAVGIGVVLGSNVFNLAALLGLGSLVAGRIALHRRVILLEGTVAVGLVIVTLLLATGVVAAPVALGLALAVFAPYCVVIGVRQPTLERLPLPRPAVTWLAQAVHEEDVELGPVPAPPPAAQRHGLLDGCTIAATLGIVIVTSVAMEHAGVDVGARYHLTSIVVGGVLLAAITSLPNVVAAVYLARKGRGAAVLSEAMNSNALNIVVGLLIPGVAIGLGGAAAGSLGIAWWYGAATVGALGVAWFFRGLTRIAGGCIIGVYVVFVISLAH